MSPPTSTTSMGLDSAPPPRKLWEHPNPRGTAMWRFMEEANRRYGLRLEGFGDLYNWSCDHRSQFYGQLWETRGWIHEGSYARVVDEAASVSQLPRWFDGVRLNLAENFLWTRGPGHSGARCTRLKDDAATAVTEVREGNVDVVHATYGQLRERVARLASAMRAAGVAEGDRVVMVGAHACQTLVVFLAAAWLGAIFSSSSTDMGVAGLLQRIVQIRPKLVFFDDAALYNGKVVDLRDKMAGVIHGLAGCADFSRLVAVPRFAGRPYDVSAMAKTETLQQFLDAAADDSPPPINRVGFQAPAVIFFTSGTTGVPKAIVHGVGPLLLTITREATLHLDMGAGHVGLQYTTTGWVMFLVSVMSPAIDGRAVLYDGSPLRPDPAVLLRVAEQQRVTCLGIGPRWMAELMRHRISPREVADLSRLATVTSTGMVLPDHMFHWFYDVAFDRHTQLVNLSGGTDIAGSFAIGNPLLPVHVGGCAGPSLGIRIEVYDADAAEGKPLPPGTPGELVATTAFPNVPLFLWGDSEPAPGAKYHGAYFARFKDVWTHGDFVVRHPATGAITFLGRSDGVLNPSGIRFGSADIYTVVERCFADDVAESLCVGRRRAQDADEAVVLFLVMKPGRALDPDLVRRVKETIARELSKRHVPAHVVEVPEIPVTVNGKKVELPVKAILSGKTVKPSGTLLNPQSLDYFYRFQGVEELWVASPARL